VNFHPNCGGVDNYCMVAEARGEVFRCVDGCAYYEKPSPLNPKAAWPFPEKRCSDIEE
jgi:hypothetical protein